MNYLDLFSGIGGFHKGFLDAGFTFDKCYFSEIDKYATQVYLRHFPGSIPLGDVSRIDGTKLGEVNLITFGFPCQDLSIAGKRKGLQGSRSGLFFQATRLIRECRPDTFIFENVKGLLSSNNGQDFETVLREIADIGLYECEWQLLNTSWFLPQNRERIYFIGHLGKGSSRKIFPIGEVDSGIIAKGRGGGLSASIQTSYHKGVNNQNQLIDQTQDLPQAYRVRSTDENAVCLQGESGGVLLPKRRIRRLTPVECERLQGFPDGWTSGLSDAQRYKCLGNAVSVPVVKAIAERLKQS